MSPILQSSQTHARALPHSHFFHSEREIAVGKAEYRLARQNRRLESSNPGAILANSCADPHDWQHEEALAVLEAWRPTFRVGLEQTSLVVARPAEDPAWLVDSWQLTPFPEELLDRDEQQQFEQARHANERAELREFRLESFRNVLKDESRDLEGLDPGEARPSFVSLPIEDDESESSAEAGRCSIALGYLQLASRHPHLSSSERETLAEGIFRYGTQVAQHERVLRSAGLTEDAASSFTLHAIRLMDNGKYHDRGVFRGWLSQVWKNWHWSKVTKKVARQRDTEVGIEFSNSDDTGRASAGYVSADVALYNQASAVDSMDYLKQQWHERIALLWPKLTAQEKRIYRRVAEGSSQSEIAQLELISVATVQRRLADIQAKAGKPLADDKSKLVANIQLSEKRAARAEAIAKREAETALLEAKLKGRSKPGVVNLEASADFNFWAAEIPDCHAHDQLSFRYLDRVRSSQECLPC